MACMPAFSWKGAARLQGHHRHVVRLRGQFPNLQDVVRAAARGLQSFMAALPG